MNTMGEDRGKSTSLRESQVTNKRVLASYVVITCVLTISYLIEVVKGSRTIPYVVVFLTLLYIPLILSFLVYRKNDESTWIKYVIAIGFGIFYGYTLFTTTSVVGFTIVLPLMTAITLYKSYKFCLGVGLGVTGINISYIMKRVMSGNYIKEEIADFEIEVACIVLVTAFMAITAKTINEIFESKVRMIELEKDRQVKVLEQILSVTDSTCMKVDEIHEEAKLMKEQSMKEQSAIEQIAYGALDVSNHIQKQLSMSNNINEVV